MIYDFLAIGIIIVCIVVIIAIIVKKFPILASINITALKKHKLDRIKKGLIEDRLKRKFSAFNVKTLFKGEADNSKSPIFEKFYQYLKNLEQRYRDKSKVREPAEEETAGKKKTILLTEAKALFEEEKFKEAEDKYIEAISLDNKYIEAYEGLAKVYYKIKDFEHTKEIYLYLIKINAKDSKEIDLEETAPSQGSIKEPAEAYSPTTSLSNQVASHQVDLGEVYMDTEEYEQALHCFQEAVKLEPNNPRNLDAIIKVAVKLKDEVLANEYYKKLKEVNPDNEKLKDILKEIRALKKKR